MSQPPPMPQSSQVTAPPLPQTGAQTLEYEARITLFDKVTVYKLDATSIRSMSEVGEQILPLADIIGVRCQFFPTRVQRNRYETLLTLRNGSTLKICNQFYKGVADFEDRSAPYSTFIKGLHNNLAIQNPQCDFRAGTTPAKFWLYAIMMVGILLLLIVLGIVMLVTIPPVAIVKLIIILFYIPTLIRWFKRNKPRQYDPREIPIDVMPS